MQVSVAEATEKLIELVRRAEAGDDIILTEQGHAAVRLVPIRTRIGQTSRSSLLASVRSSALNKAATGQNAARSQDFLYGDNGMPE